MFNTGYIELLQASSAFKRLKEDIKAQSVYNTYLLLSPDSLALKILSRLFAKEIISGSDLVLADKHPDVDILPKKEALSVADADYIVSNALVRPNMSEKKVYIIDGAEELNQATQNKLLKTLEEPPSFVHFILNCTKEFALLPTVISRSKRIELKPFSKHELRAAIGGGVVESVDFAVEASLGYLSFADKFLDQASLNLFKNILSYILDLKSSKNLVEAASKMLNYKDSLPDILMFLELIFRDVMTLRAGQQSLIELNSAREELEEIAKQYSLHASVKILEAIKKSQKRVKLYGNAVSIIDELLFFMVEYKAKYK